MEAANQTLREADANLRAARAEIRIRNADRFPTVGVDSTTSGGRYSRNAPYFNPVPAYSPSGSLQYPFQVSYEVDLWGQVRRNIAAGREEAQATFADRVNILLSLQAEVATGLFRAAHRGLAAEAAERHGASVRGSTANHHQPV